MADIWDLTGQIKTEFKRVCVAKGVCKKHKTRCSIGGIYYYISEVKVEEKRIVERKEEGDWPDDHCWNSGNYYAEPPFCLRFDYWVIQAPQIRQMLLALKGVLGENPEREKIGKPEFLTSDVSRELSINIVEKNLLKTRLAMKIPRFQAEALCQKWCDGLEPLINSKPEKVLSEFLEILKNIK